MDENKKKMLEGKIYDPFIGDLQQERINCHNLCLEYNQLTDLPPRKDEIIKILFPDSENLYLQGPIFFDFGTNTHFGKNCYANFNFSVLDICPIHIGDNVFFGPNVALMNAVHPFLPEERNSYFDKEKGYITDMEYAKPINIGSDCWIAANVVIIGGVTIGEGCVIGAGSVVTRDIPPHSFACGNPCRVKRKITKEDSIYLKKELW